MTPSAPCPRGYTKERRPRRSSRAIDRLRQEGFGEELLRAVEALTCEKGEDYFEFCKRAGCNEIARIVKLADLDDNMNLDRIPNPTRADHERVERYRQARELLLR